MPPVISVSVAWFRQRWADSARRWTWQERLGAVALVAGLLAVWWLSRHLTLGPAFALWAGCLLSCAAYFHQRKVRFFGPVCFHDLMRTGRQARYTLLRTGYVLLLLITLTLTYVSWFGGGSQGFLALLQGGSLTGRDMAEFAEAFFMSFAWVQFLAAVVFTPICVASSITDEKERKTLDGLLTTDLEDQEIILGKLASRVGHLLLVLIAGLPVLASAQFLGGVDFELVILSFVATAITIVGLACLSMLCSVYKTRIAEAVMATYLWLTAFLAVTFLLWCASYLINFALDRLTYFVGIPDWLYLPHLNLGNPFIAVFEMNWSIFGGMNPYLAAQETLLEFGFFQLLLAVYCCYQSVRKLRPVAAQPDSPTPLWRRPGIEFPPRRRRPRLGNWPPLLWKEMHADAPIGTHKFSALLMYLFLVLGWCLTAFFIGTLWMQAGFSSSMFDEAPFDWRAFRHHANALSGALGTFLGSVMLLAVAFYAAGGISRERERQTLDGLLTLPIGASDILFAKWLGTILAVRPMWWSLGIIWGVGTLTGGLHILALPLLLIAWWIYASFLCGLGLFFSLNMRSTLRATVATLLTLLGLLYTCRLLAMNGMLFFGSWLPDEFALEVVWLIDEGLFPPGAMSILSFGYDPLPQKAAEVFPRATRAVLLGLVIYGTAAWVLWRLNTRRFRKLTGETPLAA